MSDCERIEGSIKYLAERAGKCRFKLNNFVVKDLLPGCLDFMSVFGRLDVGLYVCLSLNLIMISPSNFFEISRLLGQHRWKKYRLKFLGKKSRQSQNEVYFPRLWRKARNLWCSANTLKIFVFKLLDPIKKKFI